MTSGSRVVVVGAGAIGLSTAWHLVQAGHGNVIVLEASSVASGSSGRSVGMVETQYLDGYEISMRAYGRRCFDQLERDHGLPFAHEGYLRLAHAQADLAAYELSAALQAETGCDGRVVSAAEVAGLVPDLARGACIGGLWGPTDGHVDGHRYCQLLASMVREAGGCIRSGCPLLRARFSVDGGAWLLDTSAGPVHADVVVNAAGAWAGMVGTLLGAPVTLAPQLHEVVTIVLSRPLGYVMPFVMDYLPGTGIEGVYFRQDGSHALVAGLHSDEAVHAAVDSDVPLTAPGTEFVERLAPRLANLLPRLDDARIGPGWSGLYPTSPDGLPVVGPHPSAPTVICALGAGGVGIQLSPAIGRAAAEFCLAGSSASVPPGATWSADRLDIPRNTPCPA